MRRAIKSWPLLVVGLAVALAATAAAVRWKGGAGSEAGDRGLLREVTAELGLPAEPDPWPDGRHLTPEITPGGVALLDYDNDGDLDVYQVRHSPPGDYPQAFQTPAPDRLYQQQADGSLVDVSEKSGLNDPGYGHGAAVGDVDNDGDVDVYVTNYGLSRLYRNNADGTFSDVTEAAGFSGEYWSSSAAMFDYDRDGDLDIYVCRFAKFDATRQCRGIDGRPDYCGPHLFDGVLDALYRNNGDGTFSEVTEAAGINVPNRGWGVAVADFNDDAWPDVYVANDEEPAQLWINQQNGTFVDEAVIRGCAVNGAGDTEAGMGVTLGDVDGDGGVDIFKTHINGEKNTLYRAGPGGNYTDDSAKSNLAAVSIPTTGWGCGFVDIDHDADLDLAVANGRVARQPALPMASLSDYWNHYAEPSMLFENDGQGRFEHMGERTGDFGRRAEVTRSLAMGDLDADGDLDLVTNTVGNMLRVYRNEAPKADRHWLIVRPIIGKRDAYGALVTVTSQGKKLTRVAHPAYSYLASSDPRAHFGLGASEGVESIEVLWPDGQRERFSGGGVDRVITLVQGQGEAIAQP